MQIESMENDGQKVFESKLLSKHLEKENSIGVISA